MIIDVIIPSMTTPERCQILKDSIRSLRESELSIQFNVIVVESFVSMDVGQDRTIWYDGSKFNYSRAVRQGVDASSSMWVVIAHNDVMYHKRWMFEILKAHSDRQDILSFSPWNSYHNWHDTLFHSPSNIIEGYRTSYEVVGWCVVVQRDTYVKLNTVDSSRHPDEIYASEIERCGIKHALVRKSKVEHLTSKTIDCQDSSVDRLILLETT